MGTALEVDVAHRLGDFALSVSFTVESGVAVLFGPSGAGKSLTLAIVAGLVRADAGTVAIAGRPVADSSRRLHASTQDRRIGMVFQDGLLLPHRTVLDNVALAVRDRSRRSERRSVALSWLDRVGARELAGRSPATLSGGQRQRVALARGLAGGPDLLLLDEPLSALDLSVRQDLRTLIRDIVVTTGVPSVIVTHDADEARELGDLVIDYKGDGSVSGTRAIVRPRDRRLTAARRHPGDPSTESASV